MFIINTPFQLVTSYILATSYFNGDDNQLLLLHPHGYDKWHETFSLNRMSTDRDVWQKIDVFQDWLGRKTTFRDYRNQIGMMRRAITSQGKIDRVFLASDRVIQNQLAVEASGNTTFYRLDEGLGSYLSEKRPRWTSKLWRFLRIHYLRALGGLHSDMEYNLYGLGDSKAGSADYLYKPQLLQRFSPEVIQIYPDAVKSAMGRLTQNMMKYEVFEDKACILFLSSPLVELGISTMEKEIAVLRMLSSIAQKLDLKLVYKPHPAEKRHKLERYGAEMPEITYFECIDPVEILFYAQPNIKFVLAYCSSGLFNTDIFAMQEVKPVSLWHLYGGDKRTIIKQIINAAGIPIPENATDLENIFLQSCKTV